MNKWIIGVICTSQVFIAWGQKITLELSASPDKVSVYQTVKITVTSNAEGDIVENWPDEFVKTHRMQSSWQYVHDAKLGIAKQENSIVFSGSFNKKGRYCIGPFYLKVDNKTYVSNTINIEVSSAALEQSNGNLSQKNVHQKAFACVEVSDTVIYEGEPIVVCGKVYSKERTFGSPTLKRQYMIDNVNDIHSLAYEQQWEDVTLKGEHYSSFIFDKKVIFPMSGKIIKFSPFDMYLPYGFYGVHVRSLVPTISVIPLPKNPPKNFIGAVGEFKIQQKCRSKNIKQGDIIEVEVIVSGQGNLHAIETPKIIFPSGMTVYGSPQINEDYTFGMHGAKGKITYVYLVQVDVAGRQQIAPVAFSYFDPKSKSYVQTKAPQEIIIQSDTISVVQLRDLSASTSSQDISSDQIREQEDKQSVKSSPRWAWSVGASLSVILCCASAFFFINKRNKNHLIPLHNNEVEAKNNDTNIESLIKVSIQQASFYLLAQQYEKFYLAIEKCLQIIVKFKLQEPPDAPVARHQLLAMLRANKDPYAEKIARLFHECDVARYGQRTTSIAQEQMLEDLQNIV